MQNVNHQCELKYIVDILPTGLFWFQRFPFLAWTRVNSLLNDIPIDIKSKTKKIVI